MHIWCENKTEQKRSCMQKRHYQFIKWNDDLYNWPSYHNKCTSFNHDFMMCPNCKTWLKIWLNILPLGNREQRKPILFRKQRKPMFRKKNRETTSRLGNRTDKNPSCLGNREQRKPIMFRQQRTEKTHHKRPSFWDCQNVYVSIWVCVLNKVKQNKTMRYPQIKHFEGEQKQTQSQTHIRLLTSLVQIYVKLAHWANTASATTVDQITNTATAVDQITNTAPCVDQITNTAASVDQITNTAPSVDQITNTTASVDQITNTAPSVDQITNTATNVDQITNTAPSVDQINKHCYNCWPDHKHCSKCWLGTMTTAAFRFWRRTCHSAVYSSGFSLSAVYSSGFPVSAVYSSVFSLSAVYSSGLFLSALYSSGFPVSAVYGSVFFYRVNQGLLPGTLNAKLGIYKYTFFHAKCIWHLGTEVQ